MHLSDGSILIRVIPLSNPKMPSTVIFVDCTIQPCQGSPFLINWCLRCCSIRKAVSSFVESWLVGYDCLYCLYLIMFMLQYLLHTQLLPLYIYILCYLYIYMYTYYYCVYIYIYYSDRPGDRILKMFSSQIEYEKKT